MYLLVLNQLSLMFLIGFIGFVFAKLMKINETETKFLSKFLLYLINPCMVLNTFNCEFEMEKLKQFLFVLIISFLVHLLMILISKIFFKKSIDSLAVIFTNCGFVGIPLIRGVFGNEGVFLLMGYLAVFNILIWTYGYKTISGFSNVKKIVTNPNIIAVVFGMIIFCCPIKIPQKVLEPINIVGNLNTAVSMILIGVLIANFRISDGKNYFLQITKVLIFRLIIFSLVNILFMFVIFKIFGQVKDIRTIVFVILICSMCPIATSIPSLACVFNKDATYSSLLVSFTSLLCIVSIPLFVALAEMLIKG